MARTLLGPHQLSRSTLSTLSRQRCLLPLLCNRQLFELCRQIVFPPQRFLQLAGQLLRELLASCFLQLARSAPGPRPLGALSRQRCLSPLCESQLFKLCCQILTALCRGALLVPRFLQLAGELRDVGALRAAPFGALHAGGGAPPIEGRAHPQAVKPNADPGAEPLQPQARPRVVAPCGQRRALRASLYPCRESPQSLLPQCAQLFGVRAVETGPRALAKPSAVPTADGPGWAGPRRVELRRPDARREARAVPGEGVRRAGWRAGREQQATVFEDADSVADARGERRRQPAAARGRAAFRHRSTRGRPRSGFARRGASGVPARQPQTPLGCLPRVRP